jgi:hypothetical protein
MTWHRADARVPSSACRLLSEDRGASLGQFASLCGVRARSWVGRDEPPTTRVREREAQRLQDAALSRVTQPHAVSVEDVTIRALVPPHQPQLGRCGASSVGLHARRLGWDFHGEPAARVPARHWGQRATERHPRVGIEPEPSEPSMQGE